MSMELTADIAQALATQFSRTLGTGVVISELKQGYDDTYVVIPTGGPDATQWNGGNQVENYQQFDIYCFNSNVKSCYQMAYDARKFFACLSCLQQKTTNSEYSLKATRAIGGVVDLRKTAENKQVAKFTVQITYLATC